MWAHHHSLGSCCSQAAALLFKVELYVRTYGQDVYLLLTSGIFLPPVRHCDVDAEVVYTTVSSERSQPSNLIGQETFHEC